MTTDVTFSRIRWREKGCVGQHSYARERVRAEVPDNQPTPKRGGGVSYENVRVHPDTPVPHWRLRFWSLFGTWSLGFVTLPLRARLTLESAFRTPRSAPGWLLACDPLAKSAKFLSSKSLD